MARREGSPTWFKLDAACYISMLGASSFESFTESFNSDAEIQEFIEAVGMAFLNALFYFEAMRTGHEDSYDIFGEMPRDGKNLFASLQESVEAAFTDYDRSVQSGKMGGNKRWYGGD